MNDPSSVIDAQKEQIARYQSRLKDVVSAYKSLLKEKEALDNSIKALTGSDESKQIMLSSLATLSAEKSRMEAGFQADKKNMRLEISAKDQKIKELHEKLKGLELEKENGKAKLISYDRMLTDERHLKENLETQLQQLKTQFSQSSNSDRIMKQLNQENLDLRRKLNTFEGNNAAQDSSILQALQSEMENLKHQHVKATQMEQQRVNEANEKSKKLTALHEKQVQSLEDRLSELSISISNYHRLREADQMNIAQLKEIISQLSENSKQVSFTPSPDNYKEIQTEDTLVFENSRLEKTAGEISSPSALVEGSVCREKYLAKKQLCNKLMKDNESLKQEVLEQSLHIKTLQEKVSVLNKNIDEYENEMKSKSLEINTCLKTERNKYRENIKSIEMAHRSAISQLEQQLQKQRERSLILLEEKENELRSLKTSYELFLPKKASQSNEDDDQLSSSSGKRRNSTSHHLGVVLSQGAPNSASNLPETHMIYYSNELARKEIELSGLRKAKREAETLIRQTLKEKIEMQESMDEKIANLEQMVDRLERTKSREGESLEYLKNVVISYLTATDQQASQKVYLLTAIAAVLKFDREELKLVGLGAELGTTNKHMGKKK